MKLLNTNQFIRIRSDGEGYYNSKGKWTDGEKTRTPYRGTIQPIGSSTELQKVLPEGVLLDDVLVLYTKLDLRTGNDRTGIEADDIEFMEETYEVFKVDRWYAARRLSHMKAYIYRKDRDSNDNQN